MSKIRISGNDRRYNPELSSDVVRFVLEECMFIIRVSKNLGINNQTLRNRTDNRKRKQDSKKSRIDKLELFLSSKIKIIRNIKFL